MLDQLDTEGQYNYYKAQADQLAALLPSLTDVGAITDTVAQITRATQSAYSLLDEEARRQAGSDVLRYLNEAERLAQAAIENASLMNRSDRVASTPSIQFDASPQKSLDSTIGESLTRSLKQSADATEQAINRAADRMVAQFRASLTPLERTGVLMQSAANQMSHAVESIGAGAEVTR